MNLGFYRVDITPTEPIPLTGHGNDDNRISKNVLSPLSVTCVACTDGTGKTVLLFQVDALLIPGWLAKELLEKLSARTGLPAENIILHANHLHTTPGLSGKHHPSIVRYDEMLVTRILECADQALAARTS